VSASSAVSASFADCVALFQGGNLLAAEQAIGALLLHEPRRAEAHHLQGLIAARCERGTEALRCFDAALALRPDVPELHFDRARLLQTLREPAAALPSVEAAIRLRPGWWTPYQLRGTLLADLSLPEEALASLRQALTLAPAAAAAGLKGAIAAVHGSLMQQAGRAAEAAASYEAAIAADPGCFDAHNNLGVVLDAMHRHDEALELFTQAIRLRPDAPEPYANRAALQMGLGRPQAALCDSEAALAMRPAFFEAHFSRALALRGLERPQEALAAVDAALALRSDHAGAHDARCALLLALHRPGDALRSFEQALELDPANASILRNGAVALRELRRFQEALALTDRALRIRADDALLHCARSAALIDLRRPAEALASAEEALRLAADLIAAQLNRATALADLERLDEALEASGRAVREHPTAIQAYVTHGSLLAVAARTAEALETLERALVLEPECAGAAFHAGAIHLQAGRLRQGWALYESRMRPGGPVQMREHRGARWRGEAGKRLLIQAEQGLGDALQFCRYAPLAAARGAAVTLAVHDGLEELIASVGGGVRVIGLRDAPPSFDYYSPLLSMPLAFDTTLENIPAPVPYLHAPADRLPRWRQVLGPSGFRVGVAWQGSTGRVDAGRSFPLAALAPLAGIPGVRLISLQKGAGLEQLGWAPVEFRVETPGDDIDPPGHAFADTAAIMQCCDLVVSSDTAVAHLAGALGRPAWIALKFCPDWRWLLGRTDTPWYPTLELFRQPRPGEWSGVFAAMAHRLRECLA
jgi:tetratricopeptide (TPR) repeat protein